jgi:nitrate reductase NapE component
MAMPKQRKKRRPQAAARFKIGEHVRVRQGVIDDEHLDMPLGGWAGTIARVDRRGLCLVQWSPETLKSIHPICKKRCAIEGREWEEYWLPEHQLESDPGGPLVIQQPTQITPRPLSATTPGDRVRMVFGLTSDDFLPHADEDSLETYYDHLAKRLTLPTEAKCWVEGDRFQSSLRTVTVAALDREIGWDEEEGIFCKVRLGPTEQVVTLADLQIRKSNPNYQLVDDYTEWLVGNLSEDLDDEDLDDEDLDDDDLDDEDLDDDDEDLDDELGEDQEEIDNLPDAADINLTGTGLNLVAYFMAFGAVLGPALATTDWARWGAGIGGAFLGLVMALGQSTAAQKQPFRIKRFVDIAVAFIAGVIYGAIYGVMAVAFIGAGLGVIVWLLLGRLYQGLGRPSIFELPGGGMFAAACGVVAEAFYLNPQAAAAGLGYGSVIGLGCGVLSCLAILALIYCLVRTKMTQSEYWRVRS